jgi:hypothetical protein
LRLLAEVTVGCPPGEALDVVSRFVHTLPRMGLDLSSCFNGAAFPGFIRGARWGGQGPWTCSRSCSPFWRGYPRLGGTASGRSYGLNLFVVNDPASQFMTNSEQIRARGSFLAVRSAARPCAFRMKSRATQDRIPSPEGASPSG